MVLYNISNNPSNASAFLGLKHGQSLRAGPPTMQWNSTCYYKNRGSIAKIQLGQKRLWYHAMNQLFKKFKLLGEETWMVGSLS